MLKTRLFLIFIICFLTGIVLGDLMRNQEFLRIFAIAGLMIYLFLRIRKEFANEFWKVIIVIFLAVFFGIVRFLFSFESDDSHIQNFNGYYEFEGCIADEVDVRDDKVKYTIEAERILIDKEWLDAHGLILVNGSRYPVYEYGDCLLLAGKIQKPDKIEDFYYDKYLARYQIYSVVYSGKIEKKLERKEDNLFYKWTYNLKSIFENKLSEVFAEPYASFMAGLILGSRKGIPENLMKNFNMTGLTHIIAISGYNIALVIVVISGIFSFLNRRLKVIACSIFIILFVIFVGASASVVRAAVMGVISLIALFSGRRYFVFISLFSAAFLMNLWNPKILVYDAGFQLSFSATFGIIVFADKIQKYFKWMPGFLGMREALALTLSAQIIALPLIISHFGRLSLISPIANIFVLPMIPLSMGLGFFAVIISFLSNILGNIIGFFGYLTLGLMIFFIKIFADLTFASINIEWFSWWICVGYYLLIFKKVYNAVISDI